MGQRCMRSCICTEMCFYSLLVTERGRHKDHSQDASILTVRESICFGMGLGG